VPHPCRVLRGRVGILTSRSWKTKDSPVCPRVAHICRKWSRLWVPHFSRPLREVGASGGWPRLLISPPSPTEWVPRPCVLGKGGSRKCLRNRVVTRHDPETKSFPSPHSRAPVRLRPKDRNDNCSTATALVRQPDPASLDCDAYTGASPRASSSSIR